MLTKRSPEVSAVSTVADQRLLHLLCNDRDLRARTVHDLVDSSFHALEAAKKEGYKSAKGMKMHEGKETKAMEAKEKKAKRMK